MKTKILNTRKFIWLFLLLLLSINLTACTDEGEEKVVDFVDEQHSERVEESERVIEGPCKRPEEQEFEEFKEFEPTLLELEYMYSFEVDYFFQANHDGGEFTLFETSGTRGFDEANRYIQNIHHFELPEYVDLDENSFITISMGRRLQMIYYFEEHRYDTSNCRVIARPVFKRDYYPNTVFVYRVIQLPQYRFINQEMYTDDFRQFNDHNNIPFEVWPYDGSMEIGVISIPGGRILGSTLGEGWQEFTNPLEGYIHVEETYLRSLPTEHSRVVRQLAYGDDFSIIGYVDGGMEIDGSGRWYYVWTSMNSGNQPGYIHSSFITITSEIDD